MDTGRSLSAEEVDLLIHFTISAELFWNVMIASSDTQYHDEVRELFVDDEKVRVFAHQNGCDTLVAAVRSIPDLLIIDETTISDVKCADLIKCIRSDERLHLMRILCRLRENTGESLPDWGANDYILPDNEKEMEKIYMSRKMHSQLYESGSQSDDKLHANHSRIWPRARLNIKAKIRVADSDQSGSLDFGDALVENISLGGALLSEIRLGKGSIPCGSVVMGLHIDQPVLQGLNAESKIIHREANGKTGVKFISLSREDRLRIIDLFENLN